MLIRFGVMSAFLGAACGYFCIMWTRHEDAAIQVRGWPLVSFVFKYEGGHWVDYIGSRESFAVDFLAGFGIGFVPFFILLAIGALFRLRERAAERQSHS